MRDYCQGFTHLEFRYSCAAKKLNEYFEDAKKVQKQTTTTYTFDAGFSQLMKERLFHDNSDTQDCTVISIFKVSL